MVSGAIPACQRDVRVSSGLIVIVAIRRGVCSLLCSTHQTESLNEEGWERGEKEGTHILCPEIITRRQSSLDIKVGQREIPSSRDASVPIQAEN